MTAGPATYTFNGAWSGSLNLSGGDDKVIFGSGRYSANGAKASISPIWNAFFP